jgi:replicative DNA helicase
MPESVLQQNEVAVLGNILYDNTGNTMLTVVTQLTADDFVDARNKAIYSAILVMNANNIKPDKVSLMNELTNEKNLELAGGEEYIDEILDYSVNLSSTQNYVYALQDQTLMRKFVMKLDNIRQAATTESITSVPDFIGKAEKELTELTHKRRSEGIKKMDEVSNSIVKKLIKQTKDFKEKGISPNGVTGLPSGYACIDEKTKGWHPGELIIVGARPSVGKTAFALNLLYNVAKKGKPVIFFSLEMSAESIGMRLLSRASDLSSKEIESMSYRENSVASQILIDPIGEDDAANAYKLQRGFNELISLPIYIDDNPGSKMLDIAAKCRKQYNSIGDVGLIVIDYIGLITADSHSDSRQQEVAEISRQLKQMARELNVPVIALSQLSRDSAKRGQDHTPQMSDIRDSGAIEQDADMIFMLYRKDYFEDDKQKVAEEQGMKQFDNNPISPVEIRLVKNRNGAIGDMHFSFDKEHCHFDEVTDEYGDVGPNGF